MYLDTDFNEPMLSDAPPPPLKDQAVKSVFQVPKPLQKKEKNATP
jgi:hypothetical protein